VPNKQLNKNQNGENKMIKFRLAHSIAEEMNIHTKDSETFLTTFTDFLLDTFAVSCLHVAQVVA
jgi:hypothetical protein